VEERCRKADERIAFGYQNEPVCDQIRSDARFGDLLRQMGLPA
jgi:hypothetical protein